MNTPAHTSANKVKTKLTFQISVLTSLPLRQAATRAKYPPTTLALQHFDATYGVQLGQQWPSVRVALLSERKYGALFNNFSHDAALGDLEAQGCRDFIRDIDAGGRCASPVLSMAHQFTVAEKEVCF